MSNALQVVAARQYAPTFLYTKCPTSALSNLFDVPTGYHAVLHLYGIPEGWCINFEEELCLCCCELAYFAVGGDCCGSATLSGSGQKICLPSGRYRGLLADEDGDPVTPGERDIVLKVSIMPGPCPETV